MADQAPEKNCGNCRFVRPVPGGHKCHRWPPQAFFIPASGSDPLGRVQRGPETISDWPPVVSHEDCGEWRTKDAGAGLVSLANQRPGSPLDLITDITVPDNLFR